MTIDLDHLEALAKVAQDDAKPGDWDWMYRRNTQMALIDACDPATVLELIRAARVAASSSECPVCKHHECYVDPDA